MKQNKKIIIVVMLCLFSIYVVNYFANYSKNIEILKSTKEQLNFNNSLALMYETKAGSGEYELSNDTSWPTSGYIFNKTLSKCENGSELKWDEDKGKVLLLANKSDKCYVYFDKNTFVSYIKSLYTTNGANNLYLHDSTLENGAGDGSYRYYGKYNLSSKAQTYNLVFKKEGTTGNALIIKKTDISPFYNSMDEFLSDYGYSTVEELLSNEGYSSLDAFLDAQELYGYYLAYDTAKTIFNYYGATTKAINDGYLSEINNYVCFGSSVTPCPADNLYRIIGVFKEKKVDTGEIEERVKLILSDYAGESILGTTPDHPSYNNASNMYANVLGNIPAYRWNSVNNNWQTSTFNTNVLNGTYLVKLGEWTNKIANTIWHLGGYTSYAGTAKQFYGYERGTEKNDNNPTEVETFVGLMYPSDYGFASSKDKWGSLNGFNEATANDNWLYRGIEEWTITPRSNSSAYSFNISTSGKLNTRPTSQYLGVRPTFYLNSAVEYVSGDGTQSNPYRIAY